MTNFKGWVHTANSVEPLGNSYDPDEPIAPINYDGQRGVDVTIRMTYENYRDHVRPKIRENDEPFITIEENSHDE